MNINSINIKEERREGSMNLSDSNGWGMPKKKEGREV
jgi:hypothetical protein